MNKKITLTVLMFVFMILAVACGSKLEAATNAIFNIVTDQSSNMAVITDNETGCQYIGYQLGYSGKAITPRMNAEGKQVCK